MENLSVDQISAKMPETVTISHYLWQKRYQKMLTPKNCLFRENIKVPGLPLAVVPLAPVKFWYSAGHGRCVRLEQFALTLAYTRTDFKAQGRTMLHGAVLDIQRPARGTTPSSSPYVQLSRVTSIDMVFILRPFDIAELRAFLSDELLAELAWERKEMACNTKRLYNM